MVYKHEWVNHSKNYVDPDTGAHTNRIEGTWEIRIKQHIKRMRGMPYLWRSWFLPEKSTPTDSLRGLIKTIRKYA
ncbi:hypothetical protein PHYSODRAFT_334627 [Phytophthora sojae]|uniref:ISXO2-like transposase domain-containing protein n=1 Tax=Phytophthora sojae (strain P6497) TaxID=1094619 RepID=G4ZSP6_PHYSP|nr:hypothetical protein PHYSODRAFT_334627 [Phytophthora sojae]EGZ12767.1 hypothetical protein PHYSODRAFT_334627 [Phytophthora sojae]|eukprot:XP_009530196.1 hypothetical protein PHYSODRAFT_334627 [Phytophthora sojae]